MKAFAYQKTEFYSPQYNIQTLLLNIGVPQHVYGYKYILYALELISINPEILHHITKELYPQIAAAFDSTPSRVERAIRTAIQITWHYGNNQMLHSIFGHTIRPNKSLPTNTQFLAGLYFFLN